MLLALIVSLLIVAALVYALRAGRTNGLITRHVYNNQYNDAAAAREDHLG